MTIIDPAADAVLDLPLSAAMREGSQEAHTAAEGSAFMAELTAGRIAAAGYRDYLLRLREVYDALETTGHALRAEPAVAAVLDPALHRLPALEADLHFWEQAAGEVPARAPSPAAGLYRARIEATDAWAPLYVAHHYTRYLGDLSGGQALGRILDRELGLGGHGVAFYAFPAIPKPKPYKDAYRAALDSLSLTAAERERVVDEVRVAFAMNQTVFTELGEHLEAYRR